MRQDGGGRGRCCCSLAVALRTDSPATLHARSGSVCWTNALFAPESKRFLALWSKDFCPLSQFRSQTLTFRALRWNTPTAKIEGMASRLAVGGKAPRALVAGLLRASDWDEAALPAGASAGRPQPRLMSVAPGNATQSSAQTAARARLVTIGRSKVPNVTFLYASIATKCLVFEEDSADARGPIAEDRFRRLAPGAGREMWRRFGRSLRQPIPPTGATRGRSLGLDQRLAR